MKLKDLTEKGPLVFRHHYMQTQVGEECAEHTLECPQALLSLAEKHPLAEIVVFGDESLGIKIDGMIWAAEFPHPAERMAKALDHKIWQYCNLAMGRNGDTYARQ